MPRILIASLAGILFLIAWVSAAMVAADPILRLNFAVQLGYFAIVGFVWVFPIWWLMLWAARPRA